jgi:hypothetical protein
MDKENASMNKNPTHTLYLITALLLLFCTVFVIGTTPSLADGDNAVVTYVDDDSCPGTGSGTPLDPYCKIQTAVDNAAAESEIRVAEGVYTGVQTITAIRTASIISRYAAGPVLIAAAVCSPIKPNLTCSIHTLLTTLAAPRTVIGTQTAAVFIFTTPGTDHRLRILR